MKKKLIHIFMLATLSLMVVDFVWLEISKSDEIVAEVESEKDSKNRFEELKEFLIEESKHNIFDSNTNHLTFFSCSCKNPNHYGFIRHGACFFQSAFSFQSDQLYILFQHMLID